MLVDDEPPAPDFLINVGHPQRQIEVLAVLVAAGHVLNAVALGEVAIGADLEVGQLDRNRAV